MLLNAGMVWLQPRVVEAVGPWPFPWASMSGWKGYALFYESPSASHLSFLAWLTIPTDGLGGEKPFGSWCQGARIRQLWYSKNLDQYKDPASGSPFSTQRPLFAPHCSLLRSIWC